MILFVFVFIWKDPKINLP